uniref:Uncharacterized protein AlNc14C24G2437 n=1 Tax=Albugo laibachii Nc14 TaxID=890382 RepID=F0W6D7_9STRA|nr:conserved hypothetical protein [Albugo laibachii Nc14]|eukprot:CCA16681.1 conserved hypothetical protein [Albugo laibachii Nc14]
MISKTVTYRDYYIQMEDPLLCYKKSWLPETPRHEHLQSAHSKADSEHNRREALNIDIFHRSFTLPLAIRRPSVCSPTSSNWDGVTTPRASITSTSGIVYESIVVTGHTYGTGNVVYYLLEVRSIQMPLEGYVIRRRYNDFKRLHQQLEPLMAVRNTASSEHQARFVREMPITFKYLSFPSVSLFCVSTSSNEPFSIANTRSDKQMTPKLDMSRTNVSESITCDEEEHFINLNDEKKPSRDTCLSNKYSNEKHAGKESLCEQVDFDAKGRPYLPSLPSAGILSYLTTRPTLIAQRIKIFNRILAAIMLDTSPIVTEVFMDFVQENPGTQPAYVSLSDYEAPHLPISVERSARRRAALIGRKASFDRA